MLKFNIPLRYPYLLISFVNGGAEQKPGGLFIVRYGSLRREKSFEGEKERTCARNGDGQAVRAKILERDDRDQ